MIPLKQSFSSSIGKKLITAITGLLLIGFLVSHLIGNVNLYSSHPEPFNRYVFNLWQWGSLIYVAEIGLAALILGHAINGVLLKLNHAAARPSRYKVWRSKGNPKNGPSTSNASSRYMAVSGIILLVFLILHIWTFRFGPGEAEGYVTQVNGHEARDLYRLVQERFQNPLVVGFYMFCMAFLWMHLKHAFWSGLQSMGVITPRNTKAFYCLGTLISVVLAVGFFFIPLVIYFRAKGGF